MCDFLCNKLISAKGGNIMKSKNLGKWLLTILYSLLILVFLSSICVAAEPNYVISYNSPPEWANWKSVLAAFTKATGLRAPHDNKNSGQTLSQLLAEKDNPQADVAYYGVTYGINAGEKGVVQGYKPNHWEEIPDGLKDPNGLWFTIHSGTVAFQVNKEALGDIPVPRSWKDLLNPIYKGKIGFLDPTSAFVGYAVCTAANAALGGSLDNWDPGIEFLKALKNNEPNTPKQTAYARVVMGEIPIMLGYDFNGYRMKHRDNVNVEVVIPKEGSLVMPYVMSMVAGAKRPNNAQKFLDFVLSDEGQALWGKAFVRPIRPKAMDKETEKLFLPASEYARTKAVDYKKMAEVMSIFKDRYINEVLK